MTGNLGLTRNVSVPESTRERISLDPTSPAPDSLETLGMRSRFELANANAQVSYRPTEKKTITFQGGAITADGRVTTDSELVTTADPGSPLAQLTTSDLGYQAYSASLEYRAEGSRPSELLTTSIQQYRFDPTNNVTTDFGTGEFRFSSDAFTRARIFKLDYVRPLRDGHRLLVGGSANDTHEFNRIEQSGDLPVQGAVPRQVDRRHPAAAQLRLQLVAIGQHGADHLGAGRGAVAHVSRQRYDAGGCQAPWRMPGGPSVARPTRFASG